MMFLKTLGGFGKDCPEHSFTFYVCVKLRKNNEDPRQQSH